MAQRLAEIEDLLEAIEGDADYVRLLQQIEDLRNDIADLEEAFDDEDDMDEANDIIARQHEAEMRLAQLEADLAPVEQLREERDQLLEDVGVAEEAQKSGRDPLSGGDVEDDREEVAKLKRRLSELESKLSKNPRADLLAHLMAEARSVRMDIHELEQNIKKSRERSDKRWNKLTEGMTDEPMLGKGVLGDIYGFVRDWAKVRASTKYPQSSGATLARYRYWNVVSLTVRRDPIQSLIHTAFNFITAGKWDEKRKELNYDKLFHLGLLVGLRSKRGEFITLIVEKNERISIAPAKRQDRDTEFLALPPPLPPPTFGKFMANAEAAYPDFFKYDAFRANCQDFVLTLLNANGMLTPTAEAFIKQNTDELLRSMPGYVSPLAKAITDLGAMGNVIVEGGGKGDSFGKQLREAGLSPEAYLASAKRAAKRHGYEVEFAEDGVHKLVAKKPDGGTAKFGRVGYGDFIIWSHLEKAGKAPKGAAREKRARFRKSHLAIKGEWKKNKYSPNWLAIRVLW